MITLVVLGISQPTYQERAIYLSEADNPCSYSDKYQDKVKLVITVPGQETIEAIRGTTTICTPSFFTPPSL